MPTYEYKCNACDEVVEIFHSMSEKPKKKCPECGKLSLTKMIGTGGAVIFKGSGFYQTDYRSESYKKGAEADKKATESNGSKKLKDSKASDTSTSKSDKKSTPAKADS